MGFGLAIVTFGGCHDESFGCDRVDGGSDSGSCSSSISSSRCICGSSFAIGSWQLAGFRWKGDDDEDDDGNNDEDDYDDDDGDDDGNGNNNNDGRRRR